METIINDDYIIKYFQREDGTVKGAALAPRIIEAHKEIASYMQNRFPFTQDYKEVRKDHCVQYVVKKLHLLNLTLDIESIVVQNVRDLKRESR